jgi:hypothetical protein
MKLLFEVVGNGLDGTGHFYFDDKMKAKSLRDEKPKGQRRVILGPDHKDYGVKKFPTTHHNRMMRKGKKA